jgi:Uma2 family endonuclease
MEFKFELYCQVGVRKYWVIDPEYKAVHCYFFNNDQVFIRSYDVTGTDPIEILNSLKIALEPVFTG